MTAQREFNFDSPGPEKGYTLWQTERRLRTLDLARRLNLPLEHQVEVWLNGGIRLRGKLRLQEERLFIEEAAVQHLMLVVDRVAFAYREMESCIRLD